MLRSKFNVGPGHNVLEYAHNRLHKMAKRDDVTTINGQVVSVVYVTASPTFTGVIGGYTTDGSAGSSTDSAQSISTPSVASASASPTAAASPSTSTSEESAVASTTAQVSATPSTSPLVSQSSAGHSSSSAFSYSTSTHPTTSSSSTAASSNVSTSSSSTDAGMSNAGKAGLAVGIILAIGAVLGLVLFLLAKKKRQVKQDQAREDQEKNAAIAAAAAKPLTPASAPRLSYRPASSFMPEFMGGTRPKSRLSQGNMLGGASNEQSQMREKYLATPSAGQYSIPMTEKSVTAENPFKDPENPFADPIRSAPAQPVPGSIAMPEPTPAYAPIQMPMPILAAAPLPNSEPSSEKIALAAAGAGGPVAARAAARYQGSGNITQPDVGGPEPTEMPSPPVAVPAPLATTKTAAPNSSAAPAPEGNVFRILMDFTPSMEDELELRAGQVVRMLHEYDDGWCLCTRLDRSHQGVVPRTCLAAKPSKPRPGPGQGPRPMSPAMRNGPPLQGRPMSPGMGRPMSPASGPQGRSPMVAGRAMSPGPRQMRPAATGKRSMSPGPYNQPPRPLSPGPRSSPKRSMSPGPYGHAGGPIPMAPQQRRRSNSSSQVARDVRERRQSPPGPSPLGGVGMGMAF